MSAMREQEGKSFATGAKGGDSERIVPLTELLPQAGRMVLLSGYDEVAGNDAVTAYVDVDERSAFYERALGGAPSCVALEYMAQAMALLVGLMRRRQGKKPKLGFVLGSRRLETKVACFRRGERYRVTAKCTYEDESFGSFDCAITAASGEVVATATVTAFQPEDGMTPEKLKEIA